MAAPPKTIANNMLIYNIYSKMHYIKRIILM